MSKRNRRRHQYKPNAPWFLAVLGDQRLRWYLVLFALLLLAVALLNMNSAWFLLFLVMAAVVILIQVLQSTSLGGYLINPWLLFPQRDTEDEKIRRNAGDAMKRADFITEASPL